MSLVENIRSLLAETERDTLKIVQEIQNKEKSHKRVIFQNHRINDSLISIQQKSIEILKMYSDETEVLRREINSLKGSDLMETLQVFDTKIKGIIDFHANQTGIQVCSERMEQQEMKMPFFSQPRVLNQKGVSFTAEERNGRVLDLNEHFFKFFNFLMLGEKNPSSKPLDYFTYLRIFNVFHRIEKAKKKKREYKEYLQGLADYLKDFFLKIQPLTNIELILEENEKHFDEKWRDGSVPGWEVEKSVKHSTAEIDHKTSEEAVVKNIKIGKKRKRSRKNNDGKEIAWLENLINRFCSLLSEVVEATRDHVEKKRTRTLDEFQTEMERERERDDEIIAEKKEKHVSEIDNGINPLNLPLGWDGKPIPYWLYKVNALGKEYKCEICGNYSYWGPKAFNRHFKEWRHSHGMKCLKIPNTKHFDQITSIQDALVLWKKIRIDNNIAEWNPDDEEYEDDEGNVYSKKTYEDLKKQGLL